MKISWEDVDQSSRWIHQEWKVGSSPAFIAVKILAEGISALVESIFKGLVNMFYGVISADRICFFRGVFQVFLGAGVIGICTIPLAFYELLIASSFLTFHKEEERMLPNNILG